MLLTHLVCVKLQTHHPLSEWTACMESTICFCCLVLQTLFYTLHNTVWLFLLDYTSAFFQSEGIGPIHISQGRLGICPGCPGLRLHRPLAKVFTRSCLAARTLRSETMSGWHFAILVLASMRLLCNNYCQINLRCCSYMLIGNSIHFTVIYEILLNALKSVSF